MNRYISQCLQASEVPHGEPWSPRCTDQHVVVSWNHAPGLAITATTASGGVCVLDGRFAEFEQATFASDPGLMLDLAEPHLLRHKVRVSMAAGKCALRCPPVIQSGPLCKKLVQCATTRKYARCAQDSRSTLERTPILTPNRDTAIATPARIAFRWHSNQQMRIG